MKLSDWLIPADALYLDRSLRREKGGILIDWQNSNGERLSYIWGDGGFYVSFRPRGMGKA